jgi:ubiquinone/menaquinone biosynthesis C-methylase UbiE
MESIRRVKRPKSAARRSYDRMSRMYDPLAGSSEMPFTRSGLQMLNIQSGETVLEIGPGTGKALIELCKRSGEKSLICGLDLSTGMLQVASENIKKANLAKRASLVSGDGAWLPFESNTFEAVFMSFTLELFDTPEIPTVLAECRRVLKPGGRISIVSMLKPERSNWIVRLYEWFHEVLPNYVDCRPIQAGNMIQAAGFNLAEQKVSSMWGLPVELLLAKKLDSGS